MFLRDDAEAIWRAGVQAVDSAVAVRRQISVDDGRLQIAGVSLDAADFDHIEVVGAGKAGTGMAVGVESTLASSLWGSRISGWVNVPADCVQPLHRIHLHAARPAGINEPTEAAIHGSREILNRVRSLSDREICLVLLSGGASALLCCPVPEISLADKLTVTRVLAAGGAPIQELNLVRTQLSLVKGGRLAANCHAGVQIALIISDVIGDPLDVIGSGPTVASPSRAEQALQILNDRRLMSSIPQSVITYLQKRCDSNIAWTPPGSHFRNVIVASNSMALKAATEKAEQLGYRVESLGSANAGDAAAEGRQLISQMMATKAADHSGDQKPICILSGGEPTVDLSKSVSASARSRESSGKGGRNQELILSAVAVCQTADDWSGLALLSGGTDGEDGPTDAAGAIADQALVARIAAKGLNSADYLARHDSWSFFSEVGGLFRTGPTHTNVMDLRVGLVRRSEAE
jgi:glycerate-2-kinase